MFNSSKDVFTQVPEKFDPQAWGSDDAVIQFNITGDGGGEWTVKIDSGKLSIVEGHATDASMTMTCAAQDLLAIVNGETSAVSAFMQGKVRIDGNMSLAMKLQTLLKV